MSSDWPKEFRYSLTYDGVTTVLQHEPDTWQDFSLQWKMDNLFWTRALSLGIPTKFVKDGKEIIDRAYRERGIGAKVMFKIEMFDYATEVWAYKTLYYNQLNFASLISERDYVELESEPQGLMQLLAKKGDQEFEIDMSDGVTVNYDRIEFNQYAKYNGQVDASKFVYNKENGVSKTAILIATLIFNGDGNIMDVEGGKYKICEFKTVYAEKYDSIDSLVAGGSYFVKPYKDISLTVDFDIRAKISISVTNYESGSAQGKLTFKIIDNLKNEIVSSIGSDLVKVSETSWYKNFEASLNLTVDKINVKSNRRYYAIFDFQYSIVEDFYDYHTVNYTLDSGGASEMKFKYRFNEKNVKTITPKQLGERLLEKVTEGSDGVFSFNIPDEYNQYVITCGDAIRGNADAKIKTTFNDFYKSYSRLCQLGLDITQNSDGSETAAMKILADFFTNVQAMDLGEVTELRIKPWVDKIPGVINVGYKDNTYENSDGKGEFNTEMQFSTPQTSKVTTFDLMIPYRADSYGVEYVLIDFEKDETADSKADNDVFLLHIDTANKVVWRGFPDISGTYADSTMFNAMLSPKMILMFNKKLITSMLDKIGLINGKNVIFGSSKKDMDVSIGGIKVRRSELFNLEAEKIFKPIIIEFYTGIKRFNAYELLRSNPNGYFSFTFMGKSYKGHILELNVKPAINQAQDWQMICYKSTEI